MHAALVEGQPLAAQEYHLEGAFRNIHSRLRTHAESVAFFGGGEREGATISASFRALMQHLAAVIDIRRAHKRRSCASVICGMTPCEGATISASFHALMQHLSAVIDIRRAHKRRSRASVFCGIAPRDVGDQVRGICCGGNLLRPLLCIESG